MEWRSNSDYSSHSTLVTLPTLLNTGTCSYFTTLPSTLVVFAAFHVVTSPPFPPHWPCLLTFQPRHRISNASGVSSLQGAFIQPRGGPAHPQPLPTAPAALRNDGYENSSEDEALVLPPDV